MTIKLTTLCGIVPWHNPHTSKDAHKRAATLSRILKQDENFLCVLQPQQERGGREEHNSMYRKRKRQHSSHYILLLISPSCLVRHSINKPEEKENVWHFFWSANNQPDGGWSLGGLGGIKAIAKEEPVTIPVTWHHNFMNNVWLKKTLSSHFAPWGFTSCGFGMFVQLSLQLGFSISTSFKGS